MQDSTAAPRRNECPAFQRSDRPIETVEPIERSSDSIDGTAVEVLHEACLAATRCGARRRVTIRCGAARPSAIIVTPARSRMTG